MPTDAAQKEIIALEQRLSLLEGQLARVGDMLARNEQAMTNLEETTSQIALMNTEQRFAATDYETAIGYLQELARSAHQYDSKLLNLEKV